MYYKLIFIYLSMRKRSKRHSKVTFKPYSPNQLSLLPPSLDELIATNHPVRVVNRIVSQLDLSLLHATYKGGGSSSYHPEMLLKVLIYAYLKNIYSSRKIEEALQENIHFMWLSGMSTPDHSTIADFRSNRLKGLIKGIFTSVVLLLADEGLVNIKDLYTDGTKLEASANRYTFVWAKAIKTNRERIKKQLASFWEYLETVYQEEKDQLPQKPDFTEVSAEKIEQTAQQINELLEKKKEVKEINEKIHRQVQYAEKTWGNKWREYDKKEEILAGRNSYSKTDQDATFMRTKEDHMKNGQLKPCYNLQFSTSDKVVVTYTTGQTTSDTILYQAHLEDYQEQYGCYPDSDTADAGYGSEENYEFLEEKEIEAFVKFGYFHKEQKKKFRHDLSKKENLHYNEKEDHYICPMGQKMEKIGEQRRKTKTGFEQTFSLYQARNCEGCPLRGACHKAKGNGIIQVNRNLERHKQKARELLTSEEGIKKRGQRCVDVEGTFGQLKQNKGFRRFLLRGLEKIDVELGLLCIGMNIARKKEGLAAALGLVCPDASKNAPKTTKNGNLEQQRA